MEWRFQLIQPPSERERESNSGLKSAIALCFVFACVCAALISLGLQNSANAAPASAEFNPVTIRNGAKIHVNGDKSLTAIDNGSKLVADNTNGTAVKGDAIASSLSSFASDNYGVDAIFSTNTASNPASLSEAQINSFRSYLPTVNDDYWLSNTGSRGSITWQSYATADNGFDTNDLLVTGKIDDYEYDEALVAKGSFAFNKDVLLTSYDTGVGGLWSLSYTNSKDFNVCNLSSQWFENGSLVYNNPECKSIGIDLSGNMYRSSYISGLSDGMGRKALAYVSDDGKIVQLKKGMPILIGTVLVVSFVKSNHEISDPTGFVMSTNFYGSGNSISSYVGFIRATSNYSVTSMTSEVRPVGGTLKYYSQTTLVKAKDIYTNRKSIRPFFDFANSNVVAVRDNTSGNELSTSDIFGELSSIVKSGEEKKVVVKSNSTTISNAINDTKISTDNSANGHASVTFSNGTIKVPHGAKTLTLNSSAFTTSNANYISALADAYSTQKYALLGKTGQNLTIDLSSIVNTTQVGSVSNVSFYAEQANEAGYSDVISETPVTLQIEVVEGPEQTIKYDAGGGTGTLPSNAKVRAGKSYALADGSGLSKDGNLFGCWQLTYTPYGETDEVTRLVKGNEAIVVPDAQGAAITATAMYSGVSASKKTETPSSVVTLTWDSNAPSGFTATFTSAAGSGISFNDSKSIRYDKIKIKGASIAVPSAPTLNTNTWIFDGWHTQATGGTKVETSVTPTSNTVYYAHWRNGYTVTYDATGGTGATQTGKFSGGATTDSELVMPGYSTGRPTKGYPIANNSNYVFRGWFTGVNGSGEEIKPGTSFEELGESMTVFAYYKFADTFLAQYPGSTIANPRNISGSKLSIEVIKDAAVDINKKGALQVITRSIHLG